MQAWGLGTALESGFWYGSHLSPLKQEMHFQSVLILACGQFF